MQETLKPRKLLFIVNPKAGKGGSERIIDQINKQVTANILFTIEIWKEKEHFEQISQKLMSGEYTDAVAVGGDGTVNQVAKMILNKNIALGILPAGSGNGLARSLGLSMNHAKALQQIIEGKNAWIDSGLANGTPFFCTSGLGFDAHIGNLFATSAERGLRNYIRITINELFKYRAKDYILEFNNLKFAKKAFLITVANAGQYGNDFYIAPKARMQDGLFHVVIIKPFSFLKAFEIFFNILLRRAHKSSSIETFLTQKIKILQEDKGCIHFDGEPAFEKQEVIFENKRESLKVIVGEKFAG